MQPILTSVPALTISAIFCFYNVYRQVLRRRLELQRRLHERIAYMLWMIGNETEDDDDVTVWS